MNNLSIKVKVQPEIDPGFIPAAVWNRAYRKKLAEEGQAKQLHVALEHPDKTCSVYQTEIFNQKEYYALNFRYIERIIKFLLWMKGGNKISISGDDRIAQQIKRMYSAEGPRRFDSDIIGRKIYGKDIEVIACSLEALPSESQADIKIGGNWNGCRVGFDLGGSDRKCAAVIDGEVIFSEEIPWDPYFQKDPRWHRQGINDSIKRAASKMPRVDAIGGSAAGVYIDNRIRVASLFRGVSPEDFKSYVENLFIDLQREWNNIPFIVVNDGEVTALAGAIALKADCLLGISMGTSTAGGYVTHRATITNWLNEIAFAPVDYRENAPVDEWSGDMGCAVQYFSQQAVARLAPSAGIEFNDCLSFAERLLKVQELMIKKDKKAERIYQTIGTYLGYSIAHYADFYILKNILILGRVTSGIGGEIIVSQARKVLHQEFPELAEKIIISMPDEKSKRLGQAVAAASLPVVSSGHSWRESK
jgi:predicted NBD/HSP70 family sugar kinase